MDYYSRLNSKCKFKKYFTKYLFIKLNNLKQLLTQHL